MADVETDKLILRLAQWAVDETTNGRSCSLTNEEITAIMVSVVPEWPEKGPEGEIICPSCGVEGRINHVEDIPAIRPAIRWLEDGKILFDGLVDDHDYESGHDGHVECRACGWASGPVSDGEEVEFA